ATIGDHRRTGAFRRRRLSPKLPGRGAGTGHSALLQAGGNGGGRRSSVLGPATDRRRALRNGGEDGNTPAHNTLSPETTHVQVFYPFHPLHGATLQIVRKPKRGDGAVSIIDPTGRRLKIPVWMLLPECAGIKIQERPRLSTEALLSLTSLLSTPHNPKDHNRDNLLQTAVDGCEGGHRSATTISGPDI